MPPLLQVEDLEIKYHTRAGVLTAIRDTTFTVNEGEIVGLVGESGSGKSTVASAVMRLLPPNGRISGGAIRLKGRDLVPLREEEMRRLRGRELAMIFQDAMTSLNPVFTVEEQMVDALRAKHPELRHREARQRAVEMLDRVGIADAARQIKEYPHQFSGGMRQRIMIARALLADPALLVADEPTSALDVTLEAQIIDLIRGLRDQLGTAVLYITHDLGVVAQLCDRVFVMYAGNIVEAGDVFDTFAAPKHPYTQALLQSHPSRHRRAARLRTIPGRVPSLRELPPGCKFSPRCRFAEDVCHPEEPAYAQVGEQRVLCHGYFPGWEGVVPAEAEAVTATAEEGTSRREPLGGEEVIETVDLRTHFSDHVGFLGQVLGQDRGVVRALDGIDLTIRRGETLALVGESGSGKTTFGRTVLRLEDPTAGRIVVEGKEITHLRQRQIRPMRAEMQMIFQEPAASLSPRMNVASLLLEPFRIHGVAVDPKQKVEELLEMVGLSAEQADKYPHQLSGGQARRVGIARALALKPDILVADEPTAGLDVSVAAGILNLLKDLREQLNLTYVIITHNLDEISFIADRVAVMYLGKVVELAETDVLFSRPKHPYTEALMSAISLPDPRLRERRQRVILSGEIPSPRNPPSGCPFHPRCRYAEPRCAEEEPALRPPDGEQRFAACFFPERVETIFAGEAA
ncbi:MAG: ABC transporter ATP-binding protein [Candidatus Promineifilaceae bacterium]|nr:ABC transporter ATP-binding protein [Candidatus Promineifilaceae bacterium]